MDCVSLWYNPTAVSTFYSDERSFPSAFAMENLVTKLDTVTFVRIYPSQHPIADGELDTGGVPASTESREKEARGLKYLETRAEYDRQVEQLRMRYGSGAGAGAGAGAGDRLLLNQQSPTQFSSGRQESSNDKSRGIEFTVTIFFHSFSYLSNYFCCGLHVCCGRFSEDSEVINS